ncbi:MAG: DUF1840 domain-containing protein [Nitrosomonas sp.]|nr:DUF1840 domain-containing protein [Nitrosomonas sp.]
MLVTFKTDVGDITMFGDVALQMIKLMGHSETVPGAILAKDLPLALSRLKAALLTHKAAPPADENEDEEKPAISITHRALPLISLLDAAARAGCDLMWD